MQQLILLSFLIFAVWLIRRDTASRSGISSALWIPTLWLGIIASRPVSAWLGTGGGADTLDGSPVDRYFYLALIAAALFTLSRRPVNWGWLLAKNWPIIVFYGFLFISVAWTNAPFSSFKRWFKETGNIAIVLVILTEANPMEALRAVFVRCAYLLIPLSFIFVRWFPDLGRRYNVHSGELEAVGVTFQKNALGTMILCCGLIYFWDWLERRARPEAKGRKLDQYIFFVIAGVALWLLNLCDSKTSIVALVLSSLIIYSIRVPLFRRKLTAFGTITLVAVIVFFVVDREIGLTQAIVQFLGRDMTFTGRTEVWKVLLNIGTDPLLGTGYMSFWDDPSFKSKLPYWVSSSAHNGYVETYLAGGWVGVGALTIMLLGVTAHINRGLADGRDYSAVRFSILVMMLITNFTESNFVCMTPLGFMFLLAAIGDAYPVPFGQPTSTVPQNNSRVDVDPEAPDGLKA